MDLEANTLNDLNEAHCKYACSMLLLKLTGRLQVLK